MDVEALHAPLRRYLESALLRVFRGGRFIGGPEGESFEREFARFCGARFAVGVSSGTSALRLALVAAGLRPDDEVVTTPFTFIATAEAITQAGGRVVFADIHPETGTLDPRAVQSALTRRTRAIIPVHLYGHPADMAPLRALARRRRLILIEDAAQAHGARYRGRPVGALGDAAAFSFYPSKNLGAIGDAGAVVTNDAQLADRVRRLRDHGRTRHYQHGEEGDNARLDAIQAAVLRVKLRRLAGWNRKRRALAALYRRVLTGDGGRPEGRPYMLPEERPGCEAVYHLYTVRTAAREALRAHLAARGIETAVHYPTPLHLQPAYARLRHRPGAFPVAERWSREVLSLPLHPALTTSQVRAVAAAIRAFRG